MLVYSTDFLRDKVLKLALKNKYNKRPQAGTQVSYSIGNGQGNSGEHRQSLITIGAKTTATKASKT
ncbi:hypothetical protein D3C81_2335620 [compost metagenome]